MQLYATAFFSFDLFVVYIPECKQQLITDIINADARYCTLEIWAVVLLLSESLFTLFTFDCLTQKNLV
jgi:hypothetical protein